MVSPAYVPEIGDVIKIDMGQGVGHEQGGWRPALVLSPKPYNGKTSLAVVVPITNQIKGYTFEVPLPNHMRTSGVVLADAIKSVDWRARNAKYIDTAPEELISGVHERLMVLLGFPSS
jgi:mRNA interferase MazF